MCKPQAYREIGIHECDLQADNRNLLLIAERVCDDDPNVTFAGKGDSETGYYRFDLSECWCAEADGSELLLEGQEPNNCQTTWKVVLYTS